MSEGDVNLEDDGPAVEATTETPAPAAADAPAQPVAAAPEDTAAEVDAVEVAGKKYVPIAAVLAERKQRKELAEKAAKADEYERYVNETRPYVEFLRNNPALLQQRQQPEPAKPAEPQIDPEAEAMARLMDLYTPDGKPDVARASKLLQVVDAKAAKQAQQAVTPWQQQAHQERSEHNFRIALTYKDPHGRSPSRDALAAIWRTVPPEQSADPNVASILTMTALGLTVANTQPQPAAPNQPPLVTESASSAPRKLAMSVIESNVAKDLGVNASTWQDRIAGFKSGHAHVLED